jgi:hypothetical protein
MLDTNINNVDDKLEYHLSCLSNVDDQVHPHCRVMKCLHVFLHHVKDIVQVCNAPVTRMEKRDPAPLLEVMILHHVRNRNKDKVINNMTCNGK